MHCHQVLEASNGEQSISLVEQAKTVQLENFANQFEVRGVVFRNQNFAHLAISASILLVYVAHPLCSSVPSVVKNNNHRWHRGSQRRAQACDEQEART